MKVTYGEPIDFVIIAAYMVGILLFGSFFGRYSRTTKDFFFSGQRFTWWLIALSCVSMVVGSYSFVKYSAVGFSYGLSSTQSYLNDWFLAPLFTLGWLPIIYYSRVTSIPEYFERRFDRPTRIMAVLFVMVYMVGYIGINLYTMGMALHPVIPTFSVFQWAVIIGIVTSLYCACGGQAAVIMTDLIQSILLLSAGLILLLLGVVYLGQHNGQGLGGIAAFWHGLPAEHRYPFSGFGRPDEFPMAGVFWQDFLGSSMFFYFANQGLIMRFLSVKSVQEGRKAMIVTVIFLMPLAAISVAAAGWIGRAMASYGLLPEGTDPNNIFIVVTEMIARPGVFGFVMAALIAALMSTIDALINAVAAVGVNDIYRPFIAPGRSDRHYLRMAQAFSLGFTLFGLLLVPVYMRFKSIYVAHAAFTAAISPPIIICVILAIVWKRFSARAAFTTMLLGAIVMAASIAVPAVIRPVILAHGMDTAPDAKSYEYMRALLGLIMCTAIAVAAGLCWPNRDERSIAGLWVGSILEGKRQFKGGEPNDRESGRKIRLRLVEASGGPSVDEAGAGERIARIGRADADRMNARDGDLIYVADVRWWLGGLRSLHARLLVREEGSGTIGLGPADIEYGQLRAEEEVLAERIL